MDDTPSYPKPDKRKQSLYFPEEMLAEIKHEALRQDRSLSWIVQRAWMMARARVALQPTVDPLTGKRDVPAVPSVPDETLIQTETPGTL